MSAADYFTKTALVAQTLARASAVNTNLTAIETAFGLLPDKVITDTGRVTFAVTAGAADVYTLALHKTAAAYYNGMAIDVEIHATNTGACTINVDGLGAVAIKGATGADPVAADLSAGDYHCLRYDETNGYFRITSLVRSVIAGQASMSDADIKAAYERNADTNGVTDTEKAALVRMGADGSAATPAFAFVSDLDSGFYRIGADQIGLSIGGTLRVTYSTTAITNTLPQRGPDGSAAAPAYSFSGDTDTGIYRIGTDSLGLTAGATLALSLLTGGNAQFAEEVQAKCYLGTFVTLSGATPTISCNSGNAFEISVSADTTFTFDYSGIGLTTSDVYGFVLKVSVSGTRTLTWPGSVDWPGAATPDAPAAGETNLYQFVTYDGGTTWHGLVLSKASA